MRVRSLLSSFAVAVAIVSGSAEALADKVVQLPPISTAGSDSTPIESVRRLIEAAITAVGHTPASPSEALTAEVVARGRSQDSSEVLKQVSRVASSDWAIAAHIEPRPSGYRLEIEACQASSGRVESLAREIDADNQAVEIAEMLKLLLRPEGLVNADIPWEHAAPPPPPPPAAPPAAAPPHVEAKPPTPAAPTPITPPPPPVPRRPYAENTPYGVSAGLGFLTAASHPGGARGSSASATFDLSGWYAFPQIPGLEAGGRIGWSFDGPASYALTINGRYMFPVIASPRVYVGPEVGLGAFVAAIGANNQPYFDLHVAAVGSWTIVDHVGVEVTLGGDGAMGALFLIGGAARAVVRF